MFQDTNRKINFGGYEATDPFLLLESTAPSEKTFFVVVVRRYQFQVASWLGVGDEINSPLSTALTLWMPVSL